MLHHAGVYTNTNFVLKITKMNNLHTFYINWGRLLNKIFSQSDIDAMVHGENVIILSEVQGLNPSNVSTHLFLETKASLFEAMKIKSVPDK